MKVNTILVALLVLFLMFLLFGGRVSGYMGKACAGPNNVQCSPDETCEDGTIKIMGTCK